jgi:predicted transposase YdaD
MAQRKDDKGRNDGRNKGSKEGKKEGRKEGRWIDGTKKDDEEGTIE